MNKICEIQIRRATFEDTGSLYDIHVDAVTQLCATSYSEAQIKGWFVGRTQDIYIGAIESNMIWIALTAGRPVGFTEFLPGEVSSLFVASDAAGQGVGSRLFQFALQRAQIGSRGVIKVEATKNAVGFYERYGFVPQGVGRLKRNSGFDIETVIMERREQTEFS